MGRIKAISGHKTNDKNKTVIECRAGHQKFIQVKIKNKTEFDWPAEGLSWSNDYYMILENVPRLEKFQEMIMTISFIVPKSFVGVQGQKSEKIKFNLKDKHGVIYGQTLHVKLKISI